MSRRLQPMPGALAAGVLALACSDTAPGASQLAQTSQLIIGGLVATNPLLDHTGTLTFRVRETGQTDALCSASLIGAETVVTANHCLSQMAFFESFGIDVF